MVLTAGTQYLPETALVVGGFEPRYDCEAIRGMYERRRMERGALLTQMAEVRDHVQGDVVVPLPELDRNERAAIPNLIYQGLEQISLRISSTMPTVKTPARGRAGQTERRRADLRRKAILGWWEQGDVATVQRQRARWYTAYGAAPAILRPWRSRAGERQRFPLWEPRDPLTTFPGQTDRVTDVSPEDCIFAVTRTWGWLRANYPDASRDLRRYSTSSRLDCRDDAPCTVLEYVDCEQWTTVAIADKSLDPAVVRGVRGRGSIGATTGSGTVLGSAMSVTLESAPNRAEVCPVVVPGRITLDRLMGQFDQMLGMYQMSAKLMALEVIAVEKGVFPDTYLEARPNEVPKFIAGPFDGRTGKVNIVQGGVIRELQTNPGFQTNPTIDRLERGQRLTGGIPAEFGGESASNVRTGRRGDAVLSAAVDYPIQEAQEVFAKALQEENRRAIAIAKGYWGNRESSFYVNWKGAKGRIDYKPNDIFTTDENIVTYPMAGSDANGLTIMVGQMVGMGTMSKRTAAELSPLVEDVELEFDRMQKEAMEAALLASVQQKLNAGEIAPVDGAWLMQQVLTDKMELAEAIIALDRRVQERQANSAPVGDPAGPVLPGSPEAQAGLATGTVAEAQAAQPAIGEPPEAQQNLGQLLASLRRPQMTVPSER